MECGIADAALVLSGADEQDSACKSARSNIARFAGTESGDFVAALHNPPYFSRRMQSR